MTIASDNYNNRNDQDDITSSTNDSLPQRPSSSLTSLIQISEEIEQPNKTHKWSAFVDGNNDAIYGIPSGARRVVKFHTIHKTFTEIGPELGDDYVKWLCGVLAPNGCIYCPPFISPYFLKIDTKNDTVEIMYDVVLPETGEYLWESGAMLSCSDDHHAHADISMQGNKCKRYEDDQQDDTRNDGYDNGNNANTARFDDGCIYYMPAYARRILKFDPRIEQASSVGNDLDSGYKYWETIAGKDEHGAPCLYGISFFAKHTLIQYKPSSPNTTFPVGKAIKGSFRSGKGILGKDQFIYALNASGQVLKISPKDGEFQWVGGEIYFGQYEGWGDPVMGIDGCIYWPPYYASCALKYDPFEMSITPSSHVRTPTMMVGQEGEQGPGGKWTSGVVGRDGRIYCVPDYAKHILVMDPLSEFVMVLQEKIESSPEDLGKIFTRCRGCKESYYTASMRKFGYVGMEKVLECLPSDENWSKIVSSFGDGILPILFMAVAALYDEEDAVSTQASPFRDVLPLIYNLLRRNLNGFVEILSNICVED